MPAGSTMSSSTLGASGLLASAVSEADGRARRANKPLGREDLELGSLLGEGAFARVVHATDMRNGEEYALKIVDKRMIKAKNRTASVLMEKKLLSLLRHPGIVRLTAAYQDDYSLYFVLELASGGELATQITRMNTCSMDFSRFYSAEIVSILEYLREKRVAHRDLKPENLLLTLDGHLKLIDFDAAILVPEEDEADAAGGRATNKGQPEFVGTHLYLAPEVVQGTAQLRQAFALDLWALGCIIYLMLVGKTPFHEAQEYEAFERITRQDYSFPRGFQHRAAQELIEALLAPEPQQRPGAGALEELKHYPFFGGVSAFSELLASRPPPRIDRRLKHRGEDISRSIEGRHFESLLSSAECTPQLGENFLATATQIDVSVSMNQSHSPDILDRMMMDRRMWDSRMSVEDRENVSVMRSTDPSVVGQTAPGTGTFVEDSVSAAPAPPLSSNSGVRNAEFETSRRPSVQRGALQQTSSAVPALPSNCRTQNLWSSRRAGGDWQQWLSDLRLRQILHVGEDVQMCGRVVLRRLPCLPPRVLLLTSTPRLLLLDPSGTKVRRELDLCAPGSNEEPVVSIASGFDFTLSSSCAGGRRYSCSDTSQGSSEWAEQIGAAHRKVMAWRSGQSTAQASQVQSTSD